MAGQGTSGSRGLKQEDQPAFVLHTYPYSETSLVVEAFSRQFGRIGLMAKGARRRQSALRGLLLAFQPLNLSWGGRSELRSMLGAEWVGGQPVLAGSALLCGFYLNELVLKLLAREDPHEALFDSYRTALLRLATEAQPGPVLRWFERELLREIGYAPVLTQENPSGCEVIPDAHYAYVVDHGPLRVEKHTHVRRDSVLVAGQTLLDMACDDYNDPRTQLQSKILMRLLITHRLNGQLLRTREIYKELKDF